MNYQSCSNSESVKFSSVGEKSIEVTAAQGGGDGFDGKPKLGDYIRTYPDYLCSNVKSAQAVMTVNSTDLAITKDNCTVTTFTSPLATSGVQISSFDEDFLVYRNSVFEKVEDVNAPIENAPIENATEAFCQFKDNNVGIDAVIRLNSSQRTEKGRIYLGTFVNGAVTAQRTSDFAVIKSTLGSQTRFYSTEYKFDFRVDDNSADNIVFNGTLVTSINNTDYAVATTCRRMSVEPVLPPTPFVTAVGVGINFTCAIVRGGVQCFGSNQNRQLGQPTSVVTSSVPLRVPGLNSGVTSLSVGKEHVCAIQNGNVKCWGWNSNFQAGSNNGGADVETPVLVRDTAGNLLSNVSKIYAGVNHSCAVAGGAAFCWGANRYGQLGFAEAPGLLHDVGELDYPDARPVLDMAVGVTSIATGLGYTCGVKDGGVKCWGLNDSRFGNFNVCDQGSRLLEANPPAASYKVCLPYVTEGMVLPTVSNPNVSYGFYSDCGPVTVNTRALRCNPRPIPTTSFPAGSNVLQLSAISSGMCTLMPNATVKCWGYNWGALGQGPANIANSSNTALEVIGLSGVTMLGAIAGGYCAISGGDLYCWGRNDIDNRQGAPGANFNTAKPTPLKVVGLPPGDVSYFAGGSVDETHHNCAVVQGQAYCWGNNSAGQLGDGTTTSKPQPPFSMVSAWQQ